MKVRVLFPAPRVGAPIDLRFEADSKEASDFGTWYHLGGCRIIFIPAGTEVVEDDS
jgi:hypothetical protein